MKSLEAKLLKACLATLSFSFLLLGPLRVFSQKSSLIIKPGTSLIIADKMLVLKNTDILDSGILDASNGNIYFTGGGNTVVSSAVAPVIKVFTLQKTDNGTVTLNNDITVTGMVDFHHGIVELNNQTLSLGGTGVLNNESEDARITGIGGGAVTAFNTEVGGPSQLNVGNIGAVITSSTTQNNITVSRMHKPATSPDGTVSGIQRTYLLQPANNAALNATLRFYYFDAELNGKNENTLGLWSSTDGVTWIKSGITSQNTTENYVEQTGLPTLAYFTLTDADNALPLRLVYFRASCQDKYALLEWATASEINVSHFEVEESTDGTRWNLLQSVAATNNATGSKYSFKDYSPKATALYRLKIVEKTGSSSYSAVFSGGCQDIAMPFRVSPNPAVNSAVASVSVRQAFAATIEMITVNGQRLYSAEWPLQPGNNQYNLPVQMLAAGVYVVRVLVNNTVLQTRLIKQ